MRGRAGGRAQARTNPNPGPGTGGVGIFTSPIAIPPTGLTLPTGFFRLKDSEILQVSNYG